MNTDENGHETGRRGSKLAKMIVLAVIVGLGVFLVDRYSKPAHPVAVSSAASATLTQTTAAPPPTTAMRVDTFPQPAPPPPRQRATPEPTPSVRQDSPIYQNVRDWEWLSASGRAQPGTKFFTDDGNCSAGWMVSVDSRDFILTAGHCGKRNDAVYLPHPDGSNSFLGRFVESAYTETGHADYALIELQGDSWTSSPPFEEPLAGWRGAAWLEQYRPRICHLGWRTGLSCGDFISVTGSILHFRGISDGGDSGGPVFAVVDGQLLAVGVISYGQDTDATRISASLIEEPMQRWGLAIHR